MNPECERRLSKLEKAAEEQRQNQPEAPPFKFEVGQEVTPKHKTDSRAVGTNPGCRYMVIERKAHAIDNRYRLNNDIWVWESDIETYAVSLAARFKVGDWVRHRRADPVDTMGIEDAENRVGRLVQPYPSDAAAGWLRVAWSDGHTTIMREHGLEPWQPREGEWVIPCGMLDGDVRCWFEPVVFNDAMRTSGARFIPAPFGEHAAEWFK